MIALLAETTRDQEIIDYLVDQNKKLGEEIRKKIIHKKMMKNLTSILRGKRRRVS